MIKIFNNIEKINDILLNYCHQELISDFRIIINANNQVNILIKGGKNQALLKELKEFPDCLYKFIPRREEEDYQMYFESNQKIDVTSTRLRLDNLLNSKIKKEKNKTPIVTFYSYKGGVGRSTMLATFASSLAIKKKYKVVILDCDFEAPGLNNFYLEDPLQPYNSNGLVEYFLDSEQYSLININNYYREVSKKFSGEGSIYVFPAGNLDTVDNIGKEFRTNLDHYINGLARLDFFNKDEIVKKFKDLITEINDSIKPDIILIDSRTGFNDIFGISALRLSDIVVGLFGGNVQTQPGLEFFLNILTRKAHPILLTVNSIVPNNGKLKAYKAFESLVNNYLEKISANMNGNDSFPDTLKIDTFVNGYNEILENIGMPTDSYEDYINMIEQNSFYDYSQIFDKILEYTLEIQKNKNPFDGKKCIAIKKTILKNVSDNLPSLYAENISDFDKELSNKRYYYRKSMEDLFNKDKFLVIGNKGTGKTYIYRSLGNEHIVKSLQTRANKSDIQYKFIQVFNDKKWFDTIKLDGSFKAEESDKFFERFWCIYIWNKIMEVKPYGYQTSLPLKEIEDTNETAKYFCDRINDDDYIIKIEKDLQQLDEQLIKSNNSRIVFIFDGLDQIVKPHKWSERIAPLINLCKKMNYSCISPKLFIRSDLYEKTNNINNKNDLNNKIINIEWSREELYSYFFKFVLSHSKKEFEELINIYLPSFENDYKGSTFNINDFDTQPSIDESTLRILCSCFFGKYVDVNNSNKFGESYDWFYNNLKNANDTISLRPFIDLISISVKNSIKTDKRSYPILPSIFYTNGQNRAECVERHFKDLASEQGNTDLIPIFNYIRDKASHRYKKTSLSQNEFFDLLDLIIQEPELKECKDRDSIIELLRVNGIIRCNFIRSYDGPHKRYKFALLYKYYLGLKSKNTTELWQNKTNR